MSEQAQEVEKLAVNPEVVKEALLDNPEPVAKPFQAGMGNPKMRKIKSRVERLEVPVVADATPKQITGGEAVDPAAGLTTELQAPLSTTEENLIVAAAPETKAEEPNNTAVAEESDYLQKKINKLVAEKKRAQEELEAIKANKNAYLAPQPIPVSDDYFVDPNSGTKVDVPNAMNYGNNMPAYFEDMRRFSQAKQLATNIYLHQQSESLRQQQVGMNYEAQVSAAKNKYPDYDQKVKNNQLLMAFDKAHLRASQAIMKMDNAADIAYYLGNNPSVLGELINADTDQVLMMIGSLADRIEQSNMQPRVSKAPPPTGSPKEAQVKGAGSPVVRPAAKKTISQLRQEDRKLRR